jgi:hypothetical protein
VSIDELITGVNIALNDATVVRCAAVDCHRDGHVSVECLMQAVHNALAGCADE